MNSPPPLPVIIFFGTKDVSLSVPRWLSLLQAAAALKVPLEEGSTLVLHEIEHVSPQSITALIGLATRFGEEIVLFTF